MQFVFDYAPDLVYGNGNVSVTLVCGRTLVSAKIRHKLCISSLYILHTGCTRSIGR